MHQSKTDSENRFSTRLEWEHLNSLKEGVFARGVLLFAKVRYALTRMRRHMFCHDLYKGPNTCAHVPRNGMRMCKSHLDYPG